MLYRFLDRMLDSMLDQMSYPMLGWILHRMLDWMLDRMLNLEVDIGSVFPEKEIVEQVIYEVSLSEIISERCLRIWQQ